MDMREDIFYQFFQELIESYRHDILQVVRRHSVT